MDSSSAQQVIEAIRVLYGDPDSIRKANVNSWLISFSETQAAWTIALELLDSEIVEVQYFCANMLLSKVRSQFSRIETELKNQFIPRLCFKLANYMKDGNAAPSIVLNRVCLVLAAVSVRYSSPNSDPNSNPSSNQSRFTVEELLENTFQAVKGANGCDFLTQTIITSITLLQSIAEETDHLDRMRQAAVMDSLKRRTHDVFAMLEACLNGHLSLPPALLQPKGTLCVPFLDLIHSWFKLSLNDNGRPFLTTGQLSQSHPTLWQFILQNLSSADVSAFKSATEAIVDLLSFRGGETEPQIFAIKEILNKLLSLQSHIHLSFSDPAQDYWEGNVEEVEREVCRICLTVMENFPMLMTKQNSFCDECIPIAEMLLNFTERGDRLVIEYTVEYFILLNTIPVSQRKMEFQKGMNSFYVRFMQILLRQVQYPHDFTSLDDDLDDSDSFQRFRDQVISDGLDTCYNLLGSHYLEYLCNLLQNAKTWKEVESSLFGFLSVSQSVKELLSEINIGRKASKLSEEEAKTMQIMNFLLEKIANNDNSQLFTSHSFVIESTARVIGSYAIWIAKNPSYLQGILSVLLKALQVPSATQQASNAFRNLCARCTVHLSNPTVVNHLIDHASIFLQQSPKYATSLPTAVKPSDIDSHAAIIEGLDRLISSLPYPHEIATSSSRLITPMILRICQLAKDSESPDISLQFLDSNSKLLTWHLRQLATSLQFLEIQNPYAQSHSHQSQSISNSNGLSLKKCVDEIHPCMPMVQSAWDVLAQILMSEKWIRNQPIIDSVCIVYSKSLLSFKQNLNPMIDQLLPLIISIFQRNLFSSCIEVVSTVIEISVNEKEDKKENENEKEKEKEKNEELEEEEEEKEEAKGKGKENEGVVKKNFIPNQDINVNLKNKRVIFENREKFYRPNLQVPELQVLKNRKEITKMDKNVYSKLQDCPRAMNLLNSFLTQGEEEKYEIHFCLMSIEEYIRNNMDDNNDSNNNDNDNNNDNNNYNNDSDNDSINESDGVINNENYNNQKSNQIYSLKRKYLSCPYSVRLKQICGFLQSRLNLNSNLNLNIFLSTTELSKVFSETEFAENLIKLPKLKTIGDIEKLNWKNEYLTLFYSVK